MNDDFRNAIIEEIAQFVENHRICSYREPRLQKISRPPRYGQSKNAARIVYAAAIRGLKTN
jgi:hypothetical protein